MILVDTSVWVDFFNDTLSPPCETLHQLIAQEADLSLTEIILAEILQGIKDDLSFRKVKEYLLKFPLSQPKGTETYLKAVQIYRDCRKKGKTVRNTIDCLIAAICMENDLTLLHKDSDFRVIQKFFPLKCYEG